MPSCSPNDRSAAAPAPVSPSGAPAIRPSGDAAELTSGVPRSSQGPGTYQFESHILVGPATVSVNRAAFPGRLNETVRELVARGVGTASTTPSMTTVGLTGSEAAGGTWITVRGVLTAPQGANLSDLNQAIARALANTTTFTHVAVPRATDDSARDGSQLMRLLSRPNACNDGGTAVRDQIYARACTRWSPYAGPQLTPIAPPTTPANVPLNQQVSKPPLGSTTGPVMTPTYQGTVDYTKPPGTPGGPPATSTLAVHPPQVLTTTVVPQPIIVTPAAQDNTVWYVLAAAVGVVAVVGVVGVVKRKDIAKWWDNQSDDSGESE